MKVFIWGSCVSRDCFNYPSSSSLELVKYHARCSCVSAMSKPVSLTGINIDAIASKFKRQAVIDDFQKQLLLDLETIEFDILLIDFIDERLALKIDEEGRVVTVSAELQETGSVPLDDSLVYVSDEKRFSLWHEAWNKFMEFCDRHGIRDKIVLNCVRWADHMENGEPVSQFTQNYIARHNAFLERIYEVVKKDISESRCIRYPNELLVANSNHRWGISPFLYIDKLYGYTNNFLKYIINKNEIILYNNDSMCLVSDALFNEFQFDKVNDIKFYKKDDNIELIKNNNEIRYVYGRTKFRKEQLSKDGKNIHIYIKTNSNDIIFLYRIYNCKNEEIRHDFIKPNQNNVIVLCDDEKMISFGIRLKEPKNIIIYGIYFYHVDIVSTHIQKINRNTTIRLCVNNLSKKDNGVIVFFTSAKTKISPPPIYSRLTWAKEITDYCSICVADPVEFDAEDPIQNSWYIGDDGESLLPKIADMIFNIIGDIHGPIMTYGSSMGGYAAIVGGFFLKANYILSECPQINLLTYTGANYWLDRLPYYNDKFVNIFNFWHSYPMKNNIYIFFNNGDGYHINSFFSEFKREIWKSTIKYMDNFHIEIFREGDQFGHVAFSKEKCFKLIYRLFSSSDIK